MEVNLSCDKWSDKPAVAVVFHHIGPYHHARLNAAADRLSVTGIEWSAKGYDAWGAAATPARYHKVSLFPEATDHCPGNAELRCAFWSALEQANLMWWRLMAGIISDRSLPRIAVCAAGYPWSSCLRALARMNLAPGGRKPSSGESSVCTLPHSSAASVTSSISLNLECRANGSLPDTMWSITTISRGARRKSRDVERSEVRKKYAPAGELLSCLSAIRREEEPSKANPSLRRISTQIGSRGDQSRKSATAKLPWDLVLLGDGPLRETLNSQF